MSITENKHINFRRCVAFLDKSQADAVNLNCCKRCLVYKHWNTHKVLSVKEDVAFCLIFHLLTF